jgi:PAS domain-containing protein
VIIRVWRASLCPGVEPELLDRLREAIPAIQAADAPLDFTYGFRREAEATQFLTLSVWPDYETLLEATGGDATRPMQAVHLDDLMATGEAATYESISPAVVRHDLAEGRAIGVVTGRVKLNHESVVQSMIDRSASAALDAGAIAAHLGRRLADARTEVAVVVVWPRRETMSRFVKSRTIPAIDPAFAAHLSSWRFETYRALAPGRILEPADGLAVLVLDDDGRYVEATSGTEAVLGIPGELLHGRSVRELGADDAAGLDLERRLTGRGAEDGVIDLLRPDGRLVRVEYRSAPHAAGPGLHASVLTLPASTPDPRPLRVIIAEALGLPAEGTVRPA